MKTIISNESKLKHLASNYILPTNDSIVKKSEGSLNPQHLSTIYVCAV